MLRLGKIPPAFKLGHSNRTQWYHLECLFRSFRRMCKHSRIIVSVADIEGFEKIIPEDQERIQLCILKYSRSNNNPYDASIKSVEMKEHHSDAYMEQETCKNTSITNNFISQTVPINSSLFQTPQIPFPMLTAVNPISTGIPLFPLAHVMHQSPIVGSKLSNKISSNAPAEGNKGDFDKIMDAWWHDLLQLQQIQLEKLQQKDNILPSSKKDNASDQKEKYDAV
uniref:PARP-type domain-containing protein n=1 Tax=Aureoumbra lagunensis TaxID=44058 RepID=A0A7S3NQ83_9STRA